MESRVRCGGGEISGEAVGWLALVGADVGADGDAEEGATEDVVAGGVGGERSGEGAGTTVMMIGLPGEVASLDPASPPEVQLRTTRNDSRPVQISSSSRAGVRLVNATAARTGGCQCWSTQ